MLPEVEPHRLTDKQIYKKLYLINLCASIIHAWCKMSDNLKPSFIAHERIVLSVFNWIVKNEYSSKPNIWTIYYSHILNWRSSNRDYLNKVGEYLLVENGLSKGISSYDESCLLTYEQIGIISLMGLIELWECSVALEQTDNSAHKRADLAYHNAVNIANLLVRIIENNPSSIDPKFDEHCIEVNLALILFYELGLFGPAINWIRDIIERLMLNVRMAKLFPLFHSDVEKLGTEQVDEQRTSLLLVILSEWCLVLKQLGYYRSLTEFIESELKSLNLQMWFPTKEVEKVLYTTDGSRHHGATMISIKLLREHLMLEMNIAEERVLFNEEKKFSYNQFGMWFIPFVASRHFRTYPFPNSWRTYLRTSFCFNEEK